MPLNQADVVALQLQYVIAKALCKDEAQMAAIERNYLKTVNKTILEKYSLESAVVVEKKKEPLPEPQIFTGGTIDKPKFKKKKKKR